MLFINRYCYVFLFAILLGAIPQLSTAQQKTLLINDQNQQIDLNGYLSLASWPDSLQIKHLKDTRVLKFSPKPGSTFNFGYGSKWHYIKFQAKLTTNLKNKLHLFLTKPTIQYIHLMVFDESGNKIESCITGIDYPFLKRSKPNHLFYFDLNLKQNKTYTIILCLRNHLDSLNTAIKVYTSPQIQQYQTVSLAFNLIILTIFGVVCIASAVYFISIKAWRYLFYSAYLLCVFFNVLSHEGLAYQLLWPNAPKLAMLSKCVFIFIGMTCFMGFVNQFFDKTAHHKFSKIFRICFQIITIILGILLLLYLVATYSWIPPLGRIIMISYNIVISISLIACVLALPYYFFVIQPQKDRIISILIIVAITSVCLMGTAALLNNIFPTKYSPILQARLYLWFFFIVEIIASFLLAIRNIRNEKAQAQQVQEIIHHLKTEIKIHEHEIKQLRSKIRLGQKKIHMLEGEITSREKKIKTAEEKITHLENQKSHKGPMGIEKSIWLEKLEAFMRDCKKKQQVDINAFTATYVAQHFNQYLAQADITYQYQPSVIKEYLGILIKEMAYEESTYENGAYFQPYFVTRTHFKNLDDYNSLHRLDVAISFLKREIATNNTDVIDYKQLEKAANAYVDVKIIRKLVKRYTKYEFNDLIDQLYTPVDA